MLCEIWVCSTQQFRLSEKRTFEICASLFLMTGQRNCCYNTKFTNDFRGSPHAVINKIIKGLTKQRVIESSLEDFSE